MNSCIKGKRGEREWAAFLCDHGFAARRGQQYAGGVDGPDVICPTLSGYHFEVKRTEALHLGPALDQAMEDAGREKIPVVAWRSNRRPWLVMLNADDFLRILSCIKNQESSTLPYDLYDL